MEVTSNLCKSSSMNPWLWWLNDYEGRNINDGVGAQSMTIIMVMVKMLKMMMMKMMIVKMAMMIMVMVMFTLSPRSFTGSTSIRSITALKHSIHQERGDQKTFFPRL